ncbi:Elongation factor P hydroxylase [Sinobacterium norvegicum]|uniref:Elongation factor P hydroxylase n=1 Tax=Sinobacterium norvegicum TaxID=1641715 RepID=A0ABM9AHK7_9GAMM|nr:elongation factor P hydroxylase [Sinobacterium norvegicum]CAH0992709.1 Elongation factor P hydroxylase [Sinobacterium norvegicum]
MLAQSQPPQAVPADLDGRHNYPVLISLFNQLFAARLNTRLVLGDHEPLYLPADDDCGYHRIIFAHGFFASALHELAHWCVAGEARRQQLDYGYWYIPDGRTAAQQQAFEQVEGRAQAVEWLLARACDFRFQVSVDNLTGEAGDSSAFKQIVFSSLQQLLATGVNERVGALVATFGQHFGAENMLDVTTYCVEQLD